MSCGVTPAESHKSVVVIRLVADRNILFSTYDIAATFTLNYTMLLMSVITAHIDMQTILLGPRRAARHITRSWVARALPIHIKNSYLYYLIEERIRVGNTSIKKTVFMTVIYD